MANTTDQVSAERVIPAEPQVIFDILADPAQHSVIDGSGTVKAAKGESERLTLGARFGMSMRNRVPYSTKPRVVEFEEGRKVAWQNPGGPTWRYELFPAEEGARVVETYDLTSARGAFLLKRTRLPKRTQENMERTLERLEKVVTDNSGPGA
jgi:uncharacterized protein YndB with AHSA1/START domain